MVASVGIGATAPQYVLNQPPVFTRLDTNGDGSISLDELEAAGQNLPSGISNMFTKKAPALFNKIDTNGDGQLSKSEVKSWQSNLSHSVKSELLFGTGLNAFNTADTNSDGSVSQDELSAYLTQYDPNLTSDQETKLFNAIDTNGDGSISQNETVAAANAIKYHILQNQNASPDSTSTTDVTA